MLTASRTLVALAEPSGGMAADDTTPAQYRALAVLAARGPLRMADLARALDAGAPAAGRLCDRLLRKGLIQRCRSLADRREVWVSVTTAGIAVVEGIAVVADSADDLRALQRFPRPYGNLRSATIRALVPQANHGDHS